MEFPEHSSPLPVYEVTSAMLRRLSPIIGSLVLLAANAQPAAATTIGAVVNASNDEFTNNEITIAHSPTHPLNVVTGWNDWNRNEGCGVSRSLDGGLTWRPFDPGSFDSVQCARLVCWASGEQGRVGAIP